MREELETFLAQVEAYAGSSLPQFVKDEVDAFLECGNLTRGFLRLRCTGCAHKESCSPASGTGFVRRAAHGGDGTSLGAYRSPVTLHGRPAPDAVDPEVSGQRPFVDVGMRSEAAVQTRTLGTATEAARDNPTRQPVRR
ncbi:MAG: hypothetical protein EHM59_17710 [Betaproteobacteria bacterium]|nr:MAG: hypothetical protein EHM59_17710 [Betaproteobacteria bacterium]